MPRRVTLPESKIRRRRKARRTRIVIFCAAILFILAGAIVGASWLPQARIQSVAVSGVETIATSSASEFVEKELAGRRFFFFPKNSIVLYPKSELKQKLLMEYPELISLHVGVQNFSVLEVALMDRTAAALWCGESVEDGNGCRFMDTDGFAYTPAADFSSSDLVRYYGPATTTEKFTSSLKPRQFLSSQEFRSLAALVATLAQHQGDVGVRRIIVDEARDTTLSFENGFSVFFVLRDNGADVYERFTLALASEPFLDRPISDFEYIDLRFGDKLYYHLKGR